MPGSLQGNVVVFVVFVVFEVLWSGRLELWFQKDGGGAVRGEQPFMFDCPARRRLRLKSNTGLSLPRGHRQWNPCGLNMAARDPNQVLMNQLALNHVASHTGDPWSA